VTAESTQTSPRTRRALLAGAIGGLGVWVASAIGRAAPAEAAAGDPIRMGRINRAGTSSTELQSTTNQPVFRAVQYGRGNAIRAVQLRTPEEPGSESAAAIRAEGANKGRALVAVVGLSGTAISAYSPDELGVLARCPDGIAVRGESETQIGMAGSGRVGVSGQGSEIGIAASSGGKAGVFGGTVLINGVQDLVSQSDPAAPEASNLRLFARDNGSGKMQFCIRFPTGAVQVIATEP
jgi:hypothetical protein